jgi:hypothetical protein
MRVRRFGVWALAVSICAALLVWRAVAGRAERESSPSTSVPGIRYEGPPAWSADGRRAAVLGKAENRVFVTVVDTSGTAARILRSWPIGGSRNVHLHIALDGAGRRLYYDTDEAKEPRIWEMSVATGEANEVTRGWGPAPAPLGNDLAYFDAKAILYVTHGKSVGRRVSSARGVRFEVAWSPDGKRIAYQWHSPSAGVVLAVASVEKTVPHETVAVASDVQEFEAVGWVDSNTVAYVIVRRGRDGRVTCGVISYNLITHARREILPLGRLQMPAAYVWMSDRAKYGFWRPAVSDGRRYEMADLQTGKRFTSLRFPEECSAVMSPEGTRVFAVGEETGDLYLARLSAGISAWDVGRVPSLR